MSKLLKAFRCWSLLVCMFLVVGAHSQTPQLRVRGSLQYVHGINIGWFFSRYSSDIGTNPLQPSWGNGYNAAAVNLWLADIKRMNCNVVRIWLHEDMEGLVFDANGYVSGLQPLFLANLDDLVAKLDANGLAAEFVLFNFNMGDQFGRTPPGAGAIRNFITDGAARQRLLDNAVGPLAYRYRDSLAVFAYDLINESNMALDSAYTMSQLRSFMTSASSKIRSQDSDAQVTCSTQWYAFGDQANHPFWYGGAGLDFYEFHNYQDSPNLPTVSTWLDKPLLLGEYGPSVFGSWGDTQTTFTVDQHVSQARDRNWAGTLAWMYYHSPGNNESYAVSPGGNQNWRPCAFRVQWWGANLSQPSLPPVIVFDDRLERDWSNWSWSSTVSLSASNPVQSGTRSIRVKSEAGWSGLSLRKSTAVTTSGRRRVRFWVHGGSTAKSLRFYISQTDDGTSTGDYSFVAPANQWTEVIVNLSSIGNPSAIKRINIVNNTAKALGTYMVDSLRIE